MRIALPRLVLALAAGMIGALAGPAAGAGDEGFPTNLALLDRLSNEAVAAVLDSLAFHKGDTVTVVTEGGNEGDGFIASAFGRDLARRGVAVHMTVEVTPVVPPVITPAVPPPAQQERASKEAPFASLSGDSAEVAADSLAHAAPVDTAGTSTKPPTAPAPTETVEPQPQAPARPGANVVRKVYPEGQVLEFRTLEFGVNYPGVKRRYKLFGAATVIRLGGVYVQANRIIGPGGTVTSSASGQSHYEDRLSAKARRLAEGANYPFTKPAVPPANLSRVVEPVAVVGIVSSLVYLFYQNQH